MSNQFGTTDKPFGFWYSQWEPEFPMPETSDYERADELAAKLELIEAKSIKEKYRGASSCRICHCHNGIATFIYEKDGYTYLWPSGFRHYLIEHKIQPPAYLLELLEIK
jgi:hypothetical protein